VRRAKENGMFVLCDHSIAHPQVLDYLVANEGRLPPPGHQARLGRIWRNVLADIGQADHVLVNSDFVRETFIHCGCDPQRISVLYAGVDDRFLSLVPRRSHSPAAGRPMRLMFAGDLGRRKGGRLLLQTLLRLRDLPWEFVAVGSIAPELRADFAELFADDRVVVRGHLAWPELAQEMSSADIFVFPSLAEGSARVVFMAMACGCHVITTPNAGSVVKDGVHGRLVEPGNADALESALRESLRDWDAVGAAGRRSAEFIREHYTQRCYGERLMKLYRMLAAASPPGREGVNGT
jgi:glycosyltransferase involved in cell wall biosynthesis